jgi:hypothetical protein
MLVIPPGALDSHRAGPEKRRGISAPTRVWTAGLVALQSGLFFLAGFDKFVVMDNAPPSPQQILDNEHLKLLAIFHYVLAGLSGLLACIPIIHVSIGRQ